VISMKRALLSAKCDENQTQPNTRAREKATVG